MNKKFIPFLALAVTVLAVFSPVYGQGNPEHRREQCIQELQRTDDLIVEARLAVQSSDNALAAKALERAEQYQEAARAAFADNAYSLTLTMTRKARQQAAAAISESRRNEQLEGVLNGRLEMAQDNLERARDELNTPLDPTAAALYDQARNFLTQAWEFYRSRQYRAADKMVEQVEQAIRRLKSLARNGRDGGDAFDLRLDNVQQLVEYTRELLVDCRSQTGREQLDRAEQSLQQAKDLRADNQPRAALVALGEARQAARRAARECRGGSFLEQRYQRLLKELDQARAGLSESDREHGSTNVMDLLQQAGEQLELTRGYLASDETESALLSLQAAQIALRQAERYLNGER